MEGQYETVCPRISCPSHSGTHSNHDYLHKTYTGFKPVKNSRVDEGGAQETTALCEKLLAVAFCRGRANVPKFLPCGSRVKITY